MVVKILVDDVGSETSKQIKSVAKQLEECKTKIMESCFDVLDVDNMIVENEVDVIILNSRCNNDKTDIAYLKNKFADLHIILFTDSDNYDDIRKAFVDGADDCILSNASFDLIKESLVRVCHKVLVEKNEKAVMQQKQDRTQRLEKLAKDNFINAVILKGLNDVSALQIYRQIFEIEARAYVISVEFEKFHYVKVIDNIKLDNVLSDAIGHGRKYVKGSMFPGRIVIVVCVGQMRESQIIEEAKVIADKIVNGIKADMSMNVVVGIGNPHRIENIFASYDEAVKALGYGRNSDIVPYNDIIHEDKVVNLEEINEDVRKVCVCIRNEESEAIDMFARLLLKLNRLEFSQRKNKIFEILVHIIHFVAELGSSECDYVNLIELCQEIEQEDASSVDAWAEGKFILILKSVHNKERKRNSKPIQFAKNYIEKYYAQQITLTDVAKEVGLSVQYLSKLFKEETGYNFIKWLNIFRIEKSKELLAQGKLTMTEIAEKVGYSDSNYYSRAFKKITNMTPSEYEKTVKESST